MMTYKIVQISGNQWRWLVNGLGDYEQMSIETFASAYDAAINLADAIKNDYVALMSK